MNRYEEKAKRIMERGDIILEKRKKRIIKISNTAGIVTGLCAVFAIGFGIWTNTSVKESAKPPAINESSIIIPVTEGNTEENTAYQESTVQISSENEKIDINVTSQKNTNEKTTEPAVSAAPNMNQTTPVTNITAGNVTSSAHTSAAVTGTASDNSQKTTASVQTTHIAEEATDSPRTTTATQRDQGPHTESPIPLKTTTATKSNSGIFTASPTFPRTTSTHAPGDGAIPQKTTVATEMPTPSATAPSGGSSTQPTEPPLDGTIMPPHEFIFGDDRIKYIFGENIAEESIGKYLGNLSEGVDVYSIVNVSVKEAVALNHYGVYYIYYNKNEYT